MAELKPFNPNTALKVTIGGAPPFEETALPLEMPPEDLGPALPLEMEDLGSAIPFEMPDDETLVARPSKPPSAVEPVKAPMFKPGPDFVNALSSKQDRATGESVNLSDTEHRSHLLDGIVEILNVNPYYKNRGLLDIPNFLSGSFDESPVYKDLFPEWRTEAFTTKFDNMSMDERSDFLLSRLSGLDEVTIGDMAKTAAKSGTVSAAATRVGLAAGRAAMAVTPPLLPFLGPFAKPAVGVSVGLLAGFSTAFSLNKLAEEISPRPRNLLPGQSDVLAGIETASAILGGTPTSFLYSPFVRGPAVLLERFKLSSTGAYTGTIKAPLGLRVAAKVDSLLPTVANLARKNPTTFIAADIALASIIGTTTYQAELEKDPALRMVVELGMGITPTYSMVQATKLSVPVAKRIYKLVADYGIGPMFILSKKRQERVQQNYMDIAREGMKRFKEGRQPPGEELLSTKGGRRATQQLLEFMVKMGEDPVVVANKIENGENLLDGLPPEVLKRILASGEDIDGTAGSKLSPGMRSQSPALMVLENFFLNELKKEEGSAAAQKAADFNRAVIKVFSALGGPDGAAQAQAFQQDRFANLMVDKLSRAAKLAADAARRVGSSFSANNLVPEEQQAIAIERSLSQALETQFGYARQMADRLYKAAELEVPNITVFKEGPDGREVDLPSFIRYFDKMVSDQNPETVVTWRKDAFFSEIEKTIDGMRVNLGVSGGPALSKQEQNLIDLIARSEEGAGLALFKRILSGEADLAAGSDVAKASSRHTEVLATTGQRSIDDYNRAVAKMSDEGDPALIQELNNYIANNYGRGDGPVRNATKRLMEAKRDELLAVANASATPPPPQLEVNLAGEALPTDANIAALQSILDNFLTTQRQGSSANIRQAIALVTTQKEALIAQRDRLTGDPSVAPGVEFKTLNNLRTRISNADAAHKKDADNLSGLFSQMKARIHADMNDTVDPEVSQAYNTARSFYRGFGDAILRTFAGMPSKRKGYDERVLDPEAFARAFLAGSDGQRLTKYRSMLEAAEFLRANAASKLDPEDAFAGQTVPIIEALDFNANSVKGMASEVLLRDIIAPLEKAFLKASQDADGLDTPAANQLIANRTNGALKIIQARLKTDDGIALQAILHDDVVKSLSAADNAMDFLARQKSLLASLEQSVKQDFALSQAINSDAPLRTIQAAINSAKPEESLDSLIRVIRRTGRKSGTTAGPRAFSEEDAMEGFKSNLFDFIFQNAGNRGKNSEFDPDAAFRLLFVKGVSFKDKPNTSLADFMLSRKISTKTELQNYKKILNTIASFEAGAKVSSVNLMDPASRSIVDDLAVRIAGAKFGAFVGRITPGGRAAGLIEGQVGSSFATDLTTRIPMLQQLSAFKLIVETPGLLQIALRKPQSAAEKRGLVKYMFGRLGKKLGGLLTESAAAKASRVGTLVPRLGSRDTETEVEPAIADPVLYDAPGNGTGTGTGNGGGGGGGTGSPVGPVTRAPQFTLPSRLLAMASSAQAGPPQAASGPVNMDAASSLFPNDKIFTPTAGGIGSLA